MQRWWQRILASRARYTCFLVSVLNTSTSCFTTLLVVSKGARDPWACFMSNRDFLYLRSATSLSLVTRIRCSFARRTSAILPFISMSVLA